MCQVLAQSLRTLCRQAAGIQVRTVAATCTAKSPSFCPTWYSFLERFQNYQYSLPLPVINTISVFVYICPPHCERNSAHIVRTFPSSFRCVFDIVAHNVVGKSKILQYVGVRSFSQFLIIFIVHSIQFFIVSSKISKFLKLDQN